MALEEFRDGGTGWGRGLVDPGRSGRWKLELLLLGLVLVLGAVLRFSELGQESLWYDEAWSVQAAHAPTLGALVEGSLDDSHPPLYFMLLRGWVSLFGDSEEAVRSLSAVFGALAPLAVYGLGRALSLKGWAPLLGALVYALNTQAIWYSQETRMYSLLSLTGTVHLLFVARLVRAPARRLPARVTAGWWVSGALLVQIHNFGLFFVLAGAVAIGGRAWLLSRSWGGGSAARREARRAAARAMMLRLGAALVAWGAVSLPLLLKMLHRFGEGKGIDWLAGAKVGWGTPWTILGGLAVGEQISGGPPWLRNAACGAFLLAALVPIVLLARGRNRRLGTVLPLLFALVLAGTPTVISLFRPIIMNGTRYVSVAGAPLCLAAATGLAMLLGGRWYARGTMAAVLALVVAADVAYLSVYYRFREKRMWREACQFVRSSDPSTPMVAFPDHMSIVLRYYEREKRTVVGWRSFLGHRDDYRKVWLVAEGAPRVALEPPWSVKSSALINQSYPTTSVSVFLLERTQPESRPEGSAARP